MDECLHDLQALNGDGAVHRAITVGLVAKEALDDAVKQYTETTGAGVEGSGRGLNTSVPDPTRLDIKTSKGSYCITEQWTLVASGQSWASVDMPEKAI